ncbi:MAG: hypothetical protein JRG91_17980, partial [Deltaproteobacteria bacterium]|nr:hypothetical protein [Deltaproteobacteria bacterium]
MFGEWFCMCDHWDTDCLDIYDEITIDPRPEQLDGPVDVPVEEWLCEPDATRECTTPIPPCCL